MYEKFNNLCQSESMNILNLQAREQYSKPKKERGVVSARFSVVAWVQTWNLASNKHDYLDQTGVFLLGKKIPLQPPTP